MVVFCQSSMVGTTVTLSAFVEAGSDDCCLGKVLEERAS